MQGGGGRSDRHAQRLDALNAIVQLVAGSFSFQEMLRGVHGELSRVLDATVFIVGLYLEASRTVEIVQQFITGQEVPGGSFPLGNGFTSQAIRTRQPSLIRHWSSQGPRVQVQYATDHSSLPEAGITVPILLQDRVLGVMAPPMA